MLNKNKRVSPLPTYLPSLLMLVCVPRFAGGIRGATELNSKNTKVRAEKHTKKHRFHRLACFTWSCPPETKVPHRSRMASRAPLDNLPADSRLGVPTAEARAAAIVLRTGSPKAVLSKSLETFPSLRPVPHCHFFIK